MNHKKSLLVFIVVFSSLLSYIHGSIFTTKQFLKATEGLVATQSQEFKAELEKIRLKRSLQQGEQPSEVEELHATQFDLKNGTSHNQALIHWSGNNSKVIFVLTRKKESSYMGKITHSTLWRSTDYGESYKQENDKFADDAILKSYYTSPIDKQKAVFVDNYKDSSRIWVTTDEGDTYQPHLIQFSLHKVEFHPTESEWLLGYDNLAKQLWCSTNLGRNWTAIHDYVTKDRFFWGVKDEEGDPDAKKIIHFEYRDFSVMPQRRFVARACYIPDCKDAPFQKHYDALDKIDQESLNVQDKYIFVQKPGALQKLYVSYKRGPFVKSKFSGTAVEQSDFHIISSDTGTVVVGVSHNDLRRACHLYFSDERGEKFLLSKANVRYFPRKVGDDYAVSVDIYEVKGIKGTFIMNVYDEDHRNITNISWNNGRSWNQLSDPQSHETPCDGCNLNLHILMTQTPAGYYAPLMLSKESVPGLIIAHGSVGKTVEDLPHRFRVYMSRDAGVTWYQVLAKRHLFNLADHGAMIVGVQMMFLQPVRNLWFSNDFGSTWSSHAFSKKETINVDGLLTEPGEYTHHFTLFGHKNFNDNWKLYALDFSSLVKRNCSYPGDYLNMTMPKDRPCLLGMNQMVEVLKDTAKCLVGTEYKRYTKVEYCSCTEDDYECDYGYVHDGETCIPQHEQQGRIDNIGGDYDDLDLQDLCVDGKKNVSSGYRKIPGDKCINDLEEMKMKQIECTVTPPTSSSDDWTIKILNNSAVAVVGQHLHFASDAKRVEWSITRVGDLSGLYEAKEISRGKIAFSAPMPGAYLVKATKLPSKIYSRTLEVHFWFPIEKVKLFHPTHVKVDTEYEAYAIVSIKSGLVGTRSVVGDVKYQWLSDTPEVVEISSVTANSTTVVNKHSQTGTYDIQVTASNEISQVEASGKTKVRACVQTIELKVNTSHLIDISIITDEWLTETTGLFRSIVHEVFSDVDKHVSMGFDIFTNMEVFVPPRLPLSPQLIFYSDGDNPTCDQLKGIALEYDRALNKANCFKVGTDYYNGKITVCAQTAAASTANISGGIVVLVVMIAIAFVILGFIIFRRYGHRLQCSPAYFRVSNLTRSTPMTRSHIVVRSTRNHDDREPIVDEDEFIDEELDGMESIGEGGSNTENGLGTLEFQSG